MNSIGEDSAAAQYAQLGGSENDQGLNRPRGYSRFAKRRTVSAAFVTDDMDVYRSLSQIGSVTLLTPEQWHTIDWTFLQAATEIVVVKTGDRLNQFVHSLAQSVRIPHVWNLRHQKPVKRVREMIINHADMVVSDVSPMTWNQLAQDMKDDRDLKRRVRKRVERFILNESVIAATHHVTPLQVPRQRCDFPVDALGPVLAPLAHTITDYFKVDVALAGHVLLSAATLTVQPHFNVRIDSRTIPCCNFFGVVAGSGERKSAVDNIVLKPHEELQATAYGLYEKDKHTFQIQRNALEESLKARLAKASKSSQRKRILSKVDLPVAPINPVFKFSEPTAEGIQRHFRDGKPSAGLYTNEGARFVAGHANNRKDNTFLKTAGVLEEFWDGKNVGRIRSTEESSLLLGKRLSVSIMIQPVLMPLWFGDPMLKAQGLFSRFLVISPRAMAGTREYVDADVYETAEYQTYETLTNNWLALPFPMANESVKQLAPRDLTLSDDAKAVWIDFYTETEVSQGPGQPYQSINELASKSAEHALRIACALHAYSFNCVDEAIATTTLSVDVMKQATAIMRFYLNEALRLQQETAISEDHRVAQKLLDWVQERAHSQLGRGTVLDPNKVELRTIRQFGPFEFQSKKMHQIASVVEKLVDHGFCDWIIDRDRTTENRAFRVICFAPETES